MFRFVQFLKRRPLTASTLSLTLFTVSHAESPFDWTKNCVYTVTPPKNSYFSQISALLAKKLKNAQDMINGIQEPAREVFLPDSQTDALGNTPRTLVIDVEKTLLYNYYDADYGYRPIKRPGVDQFLLRASQLGYEIVLFSSNYEQMAMPTILALDKRHVSAAALYRECLTMRGAKKIKDLARMNRDLRRVILIDDELEAAEFQPKNLVRVKPFTNKEEDKNDIELLMLIPLLAHIVDKDVEDVREVIQALGSEDTARRFVVQQKEVLKEQEEAKKAHRVIVPKLDVSEKNKSLAEKLREYLW